MRFATHTTPECLSDVVAVWAHRTPMAEAAVLGERRWTYAQLQEQIDALAAALLSVGVRKGDRVATLQSAHPDFLVAMLASTSIGAIWVGLNPKYKLPELRQVTGNSEPKILLTRTEVLGRRYDTELAELKAEISSIEHVVVFDGDPLVPGAASLRDFIQTYGTSSAALTAARKLVSRSDPCVLVYTSGSTGTPKGALLSHAAILSFARKQNEIWPVSPARVLNYFPINHIGCVVDISMPCLSAGGTVVFMESYDTAATLQTAVGERITFLGSTPSIFQMQLAHADFRSTDLSAVQLIVWEGAAMPVEAVQQLLRLNRPLATNYNMTEGPAITVLEPTRDLDLLTHSVGSAYPGSDVRVVNEDLRDSASNEPGEVWVRSECNFLGYWRNEEATQSAFAEGGYFRTGDLAIRRPDGRLKLVGRKKEMFKSGGYNVYPREVESVLEGHPNVALAAVVSVPDPRWQEVGVAFVVRQGDVTAEELDAWCRERMANYKVPKRYVIESSLPLLPIGKVNKRALQSLASRF